MREENESPSGKEDYISLPDNLCVPTSEDEQTRFATIFNAAYPDFNAKYMDQDWLAERAILAPRNKSVDKINAYATQRLPGQVEIRMSADLAGEENPDIATDYFRL